MDHAPARRPAAPTRRTALGGLALGLLTGTLAGCGTFGPPRHEEEIPDVGYQPVDPARAVAVINAYRAQNGSGPLELDAHLVRLAGEYAHHLAEAGRMTHELEPYGGLEKRLKAGGYAYATAGENLGQGYRNLDQVIRGWKNSPAHDRGMKDPDMTRMGIASAVNPRKAGDVYWCLMLAKPRPTGAAAVTDPFTPRREPEGKTHVWGTVQIPFFSGR